MARLSPDPPRSLGDNGLSADRFPEAAPNPLLASIAMQHAAFRLMHTVLRWVVRN